MLRPSDNGAAVDDLGRPTDPRDGREGRDTVAAAIAAAGSTVDHGPHQV